MNDPMTKLDCIPEDLRMPVTVSFATPQFGPHHNEGGFMLSHLSLMFDILEDVRRGEFHPNVPDDARAAIKAAVINLSDLLVQHILLHDMEKPNCMTFVYKGERKSAISADEWIAMLQDDQDGERILIGNDEAVADFCTNHHIVQISYYQETGNGKHAHGAVAAETLRKHGGFDDLLILGIETHEIAFQFGERGGVNIPLFEKFFGELSAIQTCYVLACNYIDQMASLSADGTASIGDFLALVQSSNSWRELQSVKDYFADAGGVDKHKLDRLLAELRKSPDAFQNETFAEVVKRFRAEAALPELTAEQVREALAPALDEGLSEELASSIVAEMTSSGQISKATGKKLGKFNRTVRPALAKLS